LTVIGQFLTLTAHCRPSITLCAMGFRRAKFFRACVT